MAYHKGFTILALAGIAIAAMVPETKPMTCPNTPPVLNPYQVAPGWSAVKVAGELTSPRDLVIDSKGRILIVEEGTGISQHTVDHNGCINSSRTLISNDELNHGIYLGINGNTLFASSATSVFSWPYDPSTGNTSPTPTTLITGMSSTGHVTRTLIIPSHQPNLLVVAHGSGSNLDYDAVNPSTARALVKVFDLAHVTPTGYDYVKDGWNAGYGLRNEVGLAFDGNNMLWGVENSADELIRNVSGVTTDIHQNNPAEELNFLGDVTKPNDAWYGYPTCFTVWNGTEFTDHKFRTGEQFVQEPSPSFNDSTCQAESMPPRLSFQAHTAPLGAKFDATYSNLMVTMHGSWNRDVPTGYKLVAVPFAHLPDGSYTPGADPTSNEYEDIFSPPDEGACSSGTCARPVGLVFDAMGRLYMTSDASGEVFMFSKSSTSH
ncbi:hypothetical protein F5Y15DRAFT_423210 [Xylariaceae sp. FL0016]|nr:hypothetical protein F5Y15DRAFT_423210 [Xylariaceae sp. FL0016]